MSILPSYTNQESERLVFRSLKEEDIPNWIPFFEVDDYQHFVMQDVSIPAKVRAKDWIEFQIERAKKGVYGQLAVIEKSSGKFIGVGGIIERDDVNGNHELEITYSLLPNFHGKGYATELALQFIEFVRKNQLKTSVISMIHPENNASIRVAEKNGLNLDGTTEFREIEVLIYRRTFELT